ncbi:phosphoesterase [Paenibacillus sambharensis]|uniref:Phosphoesterase n=2 Tax=Paenibacillus sambharensis TaxID=1803190 RepID=A0A2W1LSG4_9BACL|nr:phosphoesterase [Paenibacillus sambharensis]
MRALRIRVTNAEFWKSRPAVTHPTNGDEARFVNKIGSFSKALPHNRLGEVNLRAYRALIQALRTGDPALFEKLPLGGDRKLVNPQASYAFEMAGPDSHQLRIPAPPSVSSSATAAEAIELYWAALTRNIPFVDYGTDPLILEAAAELSGLSDFPAPKVNGRITPQTIFRDNLPGTLSGPFVSQFLLKPYPLISNITEQRYRVPAAAGNDFLTDYGEWLAVQNGSTSFPSTIFDPIPRYIRNGRDLAEFVHFDFSIDSGLIACRILLALGEEALDPANPYNKSNTQIGFPTFGSAHIFDFVTRAARPALEAAWYQKWLVHRRLRPENYGGLVHNVKMGNADYPINRQVLNSEALARTFDRYGSFLLPQAYPEGSPTHPSYPAGHSTFAGAMVTMLKAYFNESFVLPDPVVPSSDGLSLLPYTGRPLTVGGELNKLASNIGGARIAAGVHFRSSNLSGLKLGEAVAIGILRDYQKTYNESFNGFTLTKFDGTTITI